MSECKVYRREIEGAADGGVTSAGARAHALTCRACGDELREGERLRALVGGLGKVGAPADFEFRLRARMAAAKIDRGHGRFSGTRRLLGFAPVAVAACFVVVSATLYFRQAPRPRTTDAPAVVVAPATNAEPDRATSVNPQSFPAEKASRVEEVARVSPTAAAPPRARKPAQRVSARVVQARTVAAKGEERRADFERRTLESSFTGAQVIHLPLKASAEPLRVILRDERGAERVVPVRSVSFGSQGFLSRDSATRPPVATEVGGVW